MPHRTHVSCWLLAALTVATTFVATTSADDDDPAPTETGKKTGLIPRKVLLGNPDRAAPKLSPDGKQLSYLAPVKGVLNVWVGPADDPRAAKPVTDDRKRGIRQYFWAYDSKRVVYLQDVGGNENWQVFSVDVGTGKAKALSPEKKVAARIQEVSHRFPKEILIALNDRDERFHDVYRVNIDTGEKKLVQKNEGFAGFLTDDDYAVRFAMKLEPAGMKLYKPDDKGGGWKEYLTIPQEDNLTTQPAGFSKDGKTMYLIDSRKRDTGALTTLDLETGKQTVIASDPKADAGQAMLHPTERTVQAVSFTYLRRQWDFKDDAVKEDFAALQKVADGDPSVISRTQDDKQWLVAFVQSDGPVRYYHYDRKTKKARFLFTNHSQLADWKLQKMHPVVIPSRDKMNLVSYLTLPPGSSDPEGKGRPDKPVPMVLLVHGGPWGRDSYGLNAHHQFLANRGYAVLSVNFRGSTGFGKKFVNAGNREWAGKMHDDLIDAVEWAVKEKIAPKDKVAIMGGSYGGYATLVGLTFTPDVFACGVDIVGPSNILTLLSTVPRYWEPAIQLFKDRVGDFTTDEGKKFLTDRSPLSRVEKIKKPLLIGQGANDPRVKQAESDQIVKAMQQKKIPVSYVLFSDEGHGFARPENNLAFFAVTEAFLARHLGGRYEAIGEAFEGSTIEVPSGADDVPGLKSKLKANKDEKKKE